MNDFKDMTSVELLDIILQGDENALRQNQYELTGIMLHEDNPTYGKLIVKAFWNKLNQWLVR